MYTVNGRVTFRMSRGDGNMSVPSIMYFMKDSINLHVFDIDKGNDFLDAQGKLWAITGWNMKIFRRPKAGERIRCGTYSSGVKGMHWLRRRTRSNPDVCGHRHCLIQRLCQRVLF